MVKSQRNQKNPDRKDERTDRFFHLPKIRRSIDSMKNLGIRRPVSPVSFTSTLVPVQSLDPQPDGTFLVVSDSSAVNELSTDNTYHLEHALNSGADMTFSTLESCQNASISVYIKRLNDIVEHLVVSAFPFPVNLSLFYACRCK
jgi:hypothetical protein